MQEDKFIELLRIMGNLVDNTERWKERLADNVDVSWGFQVRFCSLTKVERIYIRVTFRSWDKRVQFGDAECIGSIHELKRRNYAPLFKEAYKRFEEDGESRV